MSNRTKKDISNVVEAERDLQNDEDWLRQRKAEKTRIYERVREEMTTAFQLHGQLSVQAQKCIAEWNELSPIFALPLEILEYIFDLLASKSVKFTLDGPHFPQHIYSSQWIVVTHVCRRWRQVALDCPSLWTRPSFQNPNMATEMMNRSKSLPLTVHINMLPIEHFLYEGHNSWRLGKAKARAFSDMGRVKSLCINQLDYQTIRPTEKEQVTGTLGPAPLLESLTVFYHPQTFTINILPQDLFDGDAPNLRHLQLKNCTLPWTESFLSSFSSLRTLCMQCSQSPIFFQYNSPLKQQSVAQMIAALRFLPHLEVLKLTDVLDSMRDLHLAAPERSVVARPPALRYLSLSGEPNSLAFVIAHIDYPASTHVRLLENPRIFHDVSRQPHVTETLHLLDARLKSNIRSLSLNANPPRSITASAGISTETLPVDLYKPENPSQFTYTALATLDRMAACNALSLESLELFRISTTVSLDICREIGALSSVRTLDICKDMVKPLITLLSTPLSQPQEPTLFPSLNRLILRRAVITTERITEFRIVDNQWVTPDFFTKCLLAREDRGVNLECLQLIDCVISSEAVNELGFVVGEVMLEG